MMYFTSNQNSSNGFSLVETLVAIAILLIIIVGPMSIATNSANSTSFANQQIMAYFLAQEGLELAQKGRDDFLLRGFDSGYPEGDNDAWNQFTDTSSAGQFSDCFSSDGCSLEMGDGNDDGLADGTVAVIVDRCSNANGCRLYLTAATDERSHYTYDSNNAEITDFTRIITMEQTPPNNNNKDVLVTSEVTWRTGNQIAEQTTTATTYLYNVYGR